MLTEKAHADATPIRIGLGDAKAFDLRVTFPGQQPLEVRNVTAQKQLTIAADGTLKAGKE